MAGNEHGRGPGRRKFVTRTHVEDAAASGQAIRVTGRDVVTDEAAQRAADLGVRIEREGAGTAIPQAMSRPTATGSAGPSTRAASTVAASADDVRRAVRKAVVAELGAEPDGLDAAIDRVMSRRAK